MCGVVHLDDAPGVRPPAHHASVGNSNRAVGPDDGERNRARYFLGLGDALLVFVFVYGRLEGVDVVESEIREDLVNMLLGAGSLCPRSTYARFKISYLFVGHRVCLGYDGNQVDLMVQPSHELDVDLLQSNSC